MAGRRECWERPGRWHHIRTPAAGRRQYADLNLDLYIGLEQQAAVTTGYFRYHVHGLVQSEDYASAMIRGRLPKVDPETRQQRVEARLCRQNLLERQERRGSGYCLMKRFWTVRLAVPR